MYSTVYNLARYDIPGQKVVSWALASMPLTDPLGISPQALNELLLEHLRYHNTEVIHDSVIKYRQVISVYFSSHSCSGNL